MHSYWEDSQPNNGHAARDGFISYDAFKQYRKRWGQPADGQQVCYKKDLLHLLACEYHASLTPHLHKAAWILQHHQGFSFKSTNSNMEMRRKENEALGNPTSPRSSGAASGNASIPVDRENFEELVKFCETQDKCITELKRTNKKLLSKVKKARDKASKVRRY